MLKINTIFYHGNMK